MKAISWFKENSEVIDLRFHSIMRFVWPLLAIPTLIWWQDSVLWVAIMSLYANFAAEVASYQGAKSVEETRKMNGDGNSEEG